MDRLSEIRARCERARREEYPEKVYGSAAYYCVTKDIPYLLEEVKQARAKRDHIKLSNDGLCVSHDNLYARLREATARAEKAEAALSGMRFAYVNKDSGTPHQFELDALKAAADILGEWPPKEGE